MGGCESGVEVDGALECGHCVVQAPQVGEHHGEVVEDLHPPGVEGQAGPVVGRGGVQTTEPGVDVSQGGVCSWVRLRGQLGAQERHGLGIATLRQMLIGCGGFPGRLR